MNRSAIVGAGVLFAGCGHAPQAGDACDSGEEEFLQRCVGSEVISCEDGRWEVNEQCFCVGGRGMQCATPG